MRIDRQCALKSLAMPQEANGNTVNISESCQCPLIRQPKIILIPGQRCLSDPQLSADIFLGESASLAGNQQCIAQVRHDGAPSSRAPS